MPRSLSEIVLELEAALDLAKNDNDILQRRIAEADRVAAAADERAEAAVKTANEINDKLRRLETLKDKEFQHLIAELFQVPSRRANALTVSAAVISILISILVTIASGIQSNADNSRTTELLIREANQIEELRKGVADGLQRIEVLNRSVSDRVAASEERILSKPQPPDGIVEIEALRREVFTGLRRIEYLNRTVADQLERSESRRIAKASPPSASDPIVQRIVSIWKDNRTHFNGYKTSNDVRTAYKMRLAEVMSQANYSLYQFALLQAGLSPALLPSKGDLEKWDRELLAVYSRMAEVAESAERKDAAPTAALLSFEANKAQGDDTDYGRWSLAAKTNSDVIGVARSQRTTLSAKLFQGAQ